MNTRHEFLLDTIGAYDEEIQAHWMINFLANNMPLIYIGSSGLQFVFYFVYNNYLHPYMVLIQSDVAQGMEFEMVNLLPRNTSPMPLPKSKHTLSNNPLLPSENRPKKTFLKRSYSFWFKLHYNKVKPIILNLVLIVFVILALYKLNVDLNFSRFLPKTYDNKCTQNLGH